MVEENISQEFRLKNIDEIKNYFLEEIEQNELMSRKHKKVSTTLNYIEHFFILASTITGCISIFDFASLHGIPLGITISAVGLKIWDIAAGIKKYKSIINKKRSMIIVFLAKSKLNKIEVLIFKALIDSNISHDMLKECAKIVWRNERRNKKFKDLNSSSKILIYL